VGIEVLMQKRAIDLQRDVDVVFDSGARELRIRAGQRVGSRLT